jgi:hypothetical protein
VREIGILNRLSGFVDDLTSLEVDEVQMRFQTGKILIVQSGQEPVRAVRAVHLNLCHGERSCSEQASFYHERRSKDAENGSSLDARTSSRSIVTAPLRRAARAWIR